MKKFFLNILRKIWDHFKSDPVSGPLVPASVIAGGLTLIAGTEFLFDLTRNWFPLFSIFVTGVVVIAASAIVSAVVFLVLYVCMYIAGALVEICVIIIRILYRWVISPGIKFIRNLF